MKGRSVLTHVTVQIHMYLVILLYCINSSDKFIVYLFFMNIEEKCVY